MGAPSPHSQQQKKTPRVQLMVLSLLLMALLVCALHLFVHITAGRPSGTILGVAELYGGKTTWPAWKDGPKWARGPSQLLVLAYQHSGAQLLTRLLMLCGVYAGERMSSRKQSATLL